MFLSKTSNDYIFKNSKYRSFICELLIKLEMSQHISNPDLLFKKILESKTQKD